MQPDFTHASTERLQTLSASLESTKHLAQLQHGRESLDAADVTALRDLAEGAVTASDTVVELPETPLDDTGPQALVETIIQPLQVAIEAELTARGDGVDVAQDVLAKQVRAIRALRASCEPEQLVPFVRTVLYHVGYYDDPKFPVGTAEEFDGTLDLLEQNIKEEVSAVDPAVNTEANANSTGDTTDPLLTGEGVTDTTVTGEGAGGEAGGDGRLTDSGKVANGESTGNTPPPEEIP